MWLFRQNRKDHWERVYQQNAATEVGWYQACPERSLKLVNDTGAGAEGNIIDIGGATSMLAGHLQDHGHKKITVLDLSENAI